MKNKIILTISMILAGLILISAVNAFGVAEPMSQHMYPGETRIVKMNMQNRAGATEDVTARMEITEGSEIASLEKTDYVVPAGGAIDALVTVSIPEDTPIGTGYVVVTKTRTINPGTAGGVAMGIGITAGFGVGVGEKPVTPPPEVVPPELPAEKPVLIPIIVAVIIIVIIFVIAIILKKRKKRARK